MADSRMIRARLGILRSCRSSRQPGSLDNACSATTPATRLGPRSGNGKANGDHESSIISVDQFVCTPVRLTASTYFLILVLTSISKCSGMPPTSSPCSVSGAADIAWPGIQRSETRFVCRRTAPCPSSHPQSSASIIVPSTVTYTFEPNGCSFRKTALEPRGCATSTQRLSASML